MAKLRLLSTGRTIRSGLQTVLVILMILGISGLLFVTELFFLRNYESYISFIFIVLGLVIALSGFFGLITKQFADGLSAGLGLHEQVKTGILTKPKSMTTEQTLNVGFDVMRIIAGIVFLYLLTFTVALLLGTFQDPEGSNHTLLYLLSQAFRIVGIIIIVAGCLGLFTKGIADTVSIGLSLHDDRLTVSGIGEKAQNHSGKVDGTNPPKLMRACPQCSVPMKFPDLVGIKIRCPKCKLELTHHGQGWLVSLTSAEE